MHGTIEPTTIVELTPLASWQPLAADIRALADRALAPNVFYEPAFAMAAATAFGGDVVGGLVWQRSPRRLIGLFPFFVSRRRYGLPMPMLVGWTHPYAPLGAPLIDRDAAGAALDAWFGRLSRDPMLPKLMLLPYLPADGPLSDAIDATLARNDGRSAAFAAHRRALLAPAGDRQHYLDAAIPAKKRKELRRQARRLGEVAPVAITHADGAYAEDAVLDFLSIEAGGWKGRAGTAAQSDETLRRFLTEAVGNLAAEDKATVSRLMLGNKAVAAAVTLRSGDSAWAWKIAYDEDLARYSPGLQLLVAVTDRLVTDARIARADSCATPDHPMIDHVWRERLALADRLIWLGGGSSLRFDAAVRLEALRRTLVRNLKSLRQRLRRAA